MNELNHDCHNIYDAYQYFLLRAIQIESTGTTLDRVITLTEGAVAFWKKDSREYISFYLYPDYRGRGIYLEVIGRYNLPVLTVKDCNIVSYLEKNRVPHLVL